jgi:hypothetical protein
MAGMTDDDDLKTLTTVMLGLTMHLGHQWTGRIDDPELSSICLPDHCRGDTVGAEDR